MVTAALLALLHAVAPRAADAPALPPPVADDAAPGAETAPEPLPAPAPEALEPSPSNPLLSSLGRGTGSGLPWQVVLALQLLALMAVDAFPYLGCVVSSWALSLLVPFGPGLPLAVAMSLVLIPPTALASGCASAALLQFLGDRLGTLRGRLACVGCASVSLSLGTYALVIAPIILGMGFFSVAAATFLSTSALLVVPHVLPGPPWLYSVAGYSVSAAGAVVAVVLIILGALSAPVVGFMLRPALVALVYRVTGRSRAAGEEQWPPSMIGERADLWWPFRRREKPPEKAPASPPAEEPPAGEAPGPGAAPLTAP